MAEQVTPMRPGQKTMVGIVVSDKMDKTVVVAVEKPKRVRLYGKTLRHTTRYKVHDPNNVCKLGDTVRLVETRPISKEKRWRVSEILQHKEVAEIKPAEIGQEIERPEQEEAAAPEEATETANSTETAEAEA
ncbi:MAG: 30S ribosomal protein S17 [Dehalococcoidia bacterium]